MVVPLYGGRRGRRSASCRLTKKQALLYEASVRELAEALEGKHGIERKGVVFAFLMRFKQICNHPAQWTASDGALGPVFSEADDTLDASVALGWRIGPGGLFDAGRRDLAAAKRSAAEIDVERAVQRVVDELRSAHAALRSREEQVKIAEQETKDAADALLLNRKRQQAGMALPLEYLGAEISHARARQDLYVALTEHNQAQLRLLIRSGGGLPR